MEPIAHWAICLWSDFFLSVGRFVHGVIYPWGKCPWCDLSTGPGMHGRVVHGPSCPWGKLSVGWVVHAVSYSWGEMSMGRVVHKTSCPWDEFSMYRVVHGVSYPWSELSMGEVVRGELLQAETSWGELAWSKLSGIRFSFYLFPLKPSQWTPDHKESWFEYGFEFAKVLNFESEHALWPASQIQIFFKCIYILKHGW
jgi:hypothetical protein